MGKAVTLWTDNTGDQMNNWHVYDDISLSDHRYKVFPVNKQAVTRLTYRNPKRTRIVSGRPEGESRGYTKSYTLSARSKAGGRWHDAAGHRFVQSPKLSIQGGSLAKDGSLVEQTAEQPYNFNKMAV